MLNAGCVRLAAAARRPLNCSVSAPMDAPALGHPIEQVLAFHALVARQAHGVMNGLKRHRLRHFMTLGDAVAQELSPV